MKYQYYCTAVHIPDVRLQIFDEMIMFIWLNVI